MRLAIRKAYLATTAIGIIALSASAAHATDPGTARPEFIDKAFGIKAPRPPVTSTPIVSDDKKDAAPIKGDLSFTLKSVNFEGLKQYTAADMKPLYEHKIGQRITVSELNAIVANITAFYRNHGYILTRAVLPPQKIDSGAVTVRIVEGFVNEVRLEGDIGPNAGVLNQFADKIKNSKPLNAKDLERYLLLMEDLPGVEARAVLRPAAKTAGASDVVITIKRKKVEAAFTLDNRGSRFLGQEQGSATLTFNNTFGRNEQTQFRVLNSVLEPAELQFFELRHEEQIGKEGTKFAFSTNYSRTRPGFSLGSLNIDGWSNATSVGLTHPLLRSRQDNWFINGDFTVRTTDVQILNIDLYRDETRVFKLGTSYDFMDKWFAVNRLEAAVSKGFDWDNSVAPNSHSRTNGDASFTKITGKATRIQPVSGPWAVFGSLSGQFTDDPLLASEEFALGGQEFGSAYDSAELTGDHGLAGRIELQYNQFRQTDFLTNYSLYGFYDHGRVWNISRIGATEAAQASLNSFGLGSRFNLNPALSGSFELAMPLDRPLSGNGTDDETARFFFNMQYRY